MPVVNTATKNKNLTPAQIFQQNKLYPWWINPGQRFNQNGEAGTDFPVQQGTKIGSLTSGTVVYVDNTKINGLGYVVQIQSSDGTLIHYQHLQASSLKRGQQVAVGDVIGTSDAAAPNGPIYYNGVLITTGPHIEVRWSKTFNMSLASGTGFGGSYWNDGQWVDPLGYITNTAGITAQQGGGPGANTTTPGSSGSVGPGPLSQLGPTADVTSVLQFMDAALVVANPFNTFISDVTTYGWVTAGVNVTWDLFLDFDAIILRTILFVVGMFLIFKVIGHWVDYGGIARNTIGTATSAVKLGALLA